MPSRLRKKRYSFGTSYCKPNGVGRTLYDLAEPKATTRFGSAKPCVCDSELPILPGRQFAGEFVLCRADLIKEIIKCLWGKPLARNERAKHIHQQQAHPNNLREDRVIRIRRLEFAQYDIAHPFTANPNSCSVRL